MTIDTTYLDADGDFVLPARPAILAMAQELNQLTAVHTAAVMGAKGGEWVSVGGNFAGLGDGTDETAIVQAAVDYAIATSGRLLIDKNYKVSTVTIEDANGLVIMSAGSLAGLSSGTYDAVLTIKNSVDVTILGRLPVSASYNSGYACGVAVYTDNGTAAAKMDLSNVIVVCAKLAWRFGLNSAPNALVSEIALRGGYTYGCPAFLEAYGTQTVVNIVGYQAISDTGANPSGWASLTRIHTRSIGAHIRYVGGECMLTDVSTGLGFSVEPIVDGTYGNQYGSIEAVGCDIEFASQLFWCRNPSAIGSLTSGRGLVNLSNCSGVHTQNSFAWGVAASDFDGSIRVQNCKFFCTTSRSQPNIQCSGNANLYVDDHSFGSGFLQGLAGLTGGIPHFSERLVLSTSNLGAQSLPNGTSTVLKFSTTETAGDLTHFAANYSAATGVFTVPTGGLKNITVDAHVAVAGLTSAELYIQVNNIPITTVAINNVTGHASRSIAALGAGDQVRVVLFNVASGPLTAGSSTVDCLQMRASN